MTSNVDSWALEHADWQLDRYLNELLAQMRSLGFVAVVEIDDEFGRTRWLAVNASVDRSLALGELARFLGVNNRQPLLGALQ